MITKTQLKILELFTAKITDKYSIKQVSEILKKPYPLIHRSIKKLLMQKYLIKDSHNFIYLNYRDNHSLLAFVESIRRDNFLKKYSILNLVIDKVIKDIKNDFFVLLIFGSAVESIKKANDLDILMIMNNMEKVEFMQKFLKRVFEMYPDLNSDINVIAIDSVYEMLAKREEINVMNETLNKHIILFGSENYYNLINNARQ